jgi:phenylacetate-CoA ligase
MDVLKLPLDQLATLGLENLKKYKALERASKSSAYNKRWNEANIKVDEINTYEDFSRLPFITSKQLRNLIYENPIDELLCCKPIHWFSSSGTTGMPKWLPYGPRDIDNFMQIRDRMYSMLPPKANPRLVTVTSPPPYVEDGLATLNMIRGIQSKNPMEGITISLTKTDKEEIFSFALDTKPNVMLAFPSFAARFAEIISENAPSVAKKQFYEHKNIKNLFVYLITKVKKINPKDLSEFKWGIFGGEPLDPYRETLTKLYGFEPFEIYTFTEFMPPAMECKIHDGMHLWLDICLAEIIPEEELEKERLNNSYIPKAIPIWEAKKGQRGEYVLTTFGEALPLIRYRFGDLIEIVDTQPCKCGCTHPRIKIPRRSDTTIICLGAIRFPSAKFEEQVLSATKFGQAQKWLLQISRQGYRPKLLITLEPKGEINDSASFIKEISKKLLEIDIIKTGLENKILADPEIRIGPVLDKDRFITKLGRIIYEGEEQ